MMMETSDTYILVVKALVMIIIRFESEQVYPVTVFELILRSTQLKLVSKEGANYDGKETVMVEVLVI
jgi:hypothetical protein